VTRILVDNVLNIERLCDKIEQTYPVALILLEINEAALSLSSLKEEGSEEQPRTILATPDVSRPNIKEEQVQQVIQIARSPK
jgi:hypothetical protein